VRPADHYRENGKDIIEESGRRPEGVAHHYALVNDLKASCSTTKVCTIM
jgi:hypothetical protein